MNLEELYQQIVEKVIQRNQVVFEEPVELLGLNFYDARRYKQYLTSTYFVLF